MTGSKNWSAGDVLNAADVNSILADQVVMVAADSSARDALFGGAGEPTLAEGMCVYLTGSDELQMYDGSTWRTVGQSSWTDYTPASTSWSGSYEVSSTMLISRTVFWRGRFILDATPSGNLTMTPPFTADAITKAGVSGSGIANDLSLSDTYAAAPYVASGNVQFWEMQSTTVGIISAANPFTWASGDSIRWLMIYEQD